MSDKGPADMAGAAIREPRRDDSRLLDVQMGLFGGQAFLVCLDLGLFARLAETPMTVAEIAQAFDLAPRAAEALVLVPVTLGFLERRGERYHLSAIAEDYLVPGTPLYMGDFLRGATFAQPELSSYPSVKRSIMENRTQIYDGGELFSTHEEQAAQARIFTMMMHGHSIAPGLAWPDKFDLAASRRMIDIGGGSGAHAIGAALRWPDLNAVVFERPNVADVALEQIAAFGLQDRVTTEIGDFFTDDLPAGDLHFYGDIFHDWPDETCLDLAAKSFAALAPGGRIMIHEIVFNDDKTGPFAAAALSVVMLAWTEGKQRSGAELGDILLEAGFVEPSTTSTFGYWSVVEARKP
jgi:hypothetical protein